LGFFRSISRNAQVPLKKEKKRKGNAQVYFIPINAVRSVKICMWALHQKSDPKAKNILEAVWILLIGGIEIYLIN
jgi:hypothetical protein